MKITLTAVSDNGENRGERVRAAADGLPEGQTVEQVWYEGKETKEQLFERIEEKINLELAKTQKAAGRLVELQMAKEIL